MKKRIKVAPVLVLSSLGLLGIAHEPTPRPKASEEFITSVYARQTGEERWHASEARKKQILAEIRRIRKRIRLQAETYVAPDKNKIVAYSAREKRNLHAMVLVMNINNYNNLKRLQDEGNNGSQRKVTVDFNTL